ncbi:MAG: Rid family hydrolase [Pseudomonadota bacterium]
MSSRRENFSTGSHFEKTFGYSRAVKVGETVYLSGTVGLNYETGTFPADPVDQFHQAISNIKLGLGMAGARLEEVVEIVVYVVSPNTMTAIGPALGETFGNIRPTNTALVVGFPFPEIQLEIKVTAIIGCA